MSEDPGDKAILAILEDYVSWKIETNSRMNLIQLQIIIAFIAIGIILY